MYELYPYFTNDGSVGLYSPKDDDIYHSTYGALSEAYEKFVLPANLNEFLKNHNEIKVLDICYGIGYNSKCFLNFFLENFDKKLSDLNATIDTIGTDNKLGKIYIKAIDTDKNLIYMSPFIKRAGANIFNNRLEFSHDKISRLLSRKTKPKYKLKKFINIIFLKKIIKNNPEIFEDDEFNSLISSRKYQKYFDAKIYRLYRFYKSRGYKNTPLRRLRAFLHNIYYRYISTSYKKASKYLRLLDFTFETACGDARKVIQEDENVYDFIFLDAFTPAKCPCLWTVDFFKELHKHLDENGMILTYSNSAAVRNAFIQAGFWVGKTYNKETDKFMGTVAAKKLELIKIGLSEYDLGLIKTKAGIFYRDENYNLTNEAIIEAHKKEVSASNKISSSAFIKKYRNKCTNYY